MSADHRPEPPLAGTEWEMLAGYLEYHRAILRHKTSHLGREGMTLRVAPSSMTLIGLLKHLAYVEDEWAVHRLQGHDRAAPWDTIDWGADPDWDWNSALEEDTETVQALWLASVARSRAILLDAFERGGLDAELARPFAEGGRPTLRWLMVHLIEEYARHNGHADLLREAADGSVGE